MKRWLTGALLLASTAALPLCSQEPPSPAANDAVLALEPARPPLPIPLPDRLTPPDLGEVLDGAAQLQSGTGPVAILLGVFGAIGGMFVADWWADRNCEENCGQADIPTLFLGGALGGIIGYLVGGGELPEQEPPRR